MNRFTIEHSTTNPASIYLVDSQEKRAAPFTITVLEVLSDELTEVNTNPEEAAWAVETFRWIPLEEARA